MSFSVNEYSAIRCGIAGSCSRQLRAENLAARSGDHDEHGLGDRLRAAAVQLEANVELLHQEAREPMSVVLDVLRYADQIDLRSNAPFAHYETAETMLHTTIGYGSRYRYRTLCRA